MWIFFKHKQCNNTFLRQYLVNRPTMYPGLTRRTFNLKNYGKTEILAIRTKFLKFPIPPKQTNKKKNILKL